MSAKKIAELRESISSLMDNMHIMSFFKDAETGQYLACNQAFADYASKASPAVCPGMMKILMLQLYLNAPTN